MEQTQENMGECGGQEKGKSRRRSRAWNDFDLSEDGTFATCKNCRNKFSCDSKNGTSHLLRHKCGEQGGPPQKQARQPAAATNGGEPSVLLIDGNENTDLLDQLSSLPGPAQSNSWFNQEECVAELARMVSFHGYPSSIVDDECFKSFVRRLNPEFEMPSRAAIEATCRQRAQDATEQLKETLKHYSGKISLALGTAETDQGKALYMACQFIDEEWNLQKRILQVFKVVPFPPYHHGALRGMEEVSIDTSKTARALLQAKGFAIFFQFTHLLDIITPAIVLHIAAHSIPYILGGLRCILHSTKFDTGSHEQGTCAPLMDILRYWPRGPGRQGLLRLQRDHRRILPHGRAGPEVSGTWGEQEIEA